MAEIIIETKIRGEWKRYEPACEQYKGDLEDMAHAACKIMAGCIASADWPGSEIRCTWDEGEESPAVITMLSNDPMLDDYIVEARENLRQYAESQRYAFRNAE